MKRFVSYIALAVALAVAPVARAEAASPRQLADLALAERYWGGPTPLCEAVVIEPLVHPSSVLYVGWAEGPTTPQTECHIWLAGGVPPRELCYLMIHEYGHLFGIRESPDPASIMNQAVMNPHQHVALCDRLYSSM